MERLVGISEIAEMLGISRQRASVLGSRRDFPPPIAELAMGPIWRAADVEKWAATRKRRPRR